MNRKEFSKLFQWAKRKAIRYIIGSNVPGIGIQAFSVLSTGTPDTVVLASTYVNGHALINMANTNYQVLVDGETANDKISVDESSKTTLGFDILQGTAAEVLHVVVIGTLAGMPDFT